MPRRGNGNPTFWPNCGLVEEANRYAEFSVCGGLVPARRSIGHGCGVSGNREEGKVAETARRGEEGARAKERIDQWVRGETAYCPPYGPIRLRIVGDELQTSLGARVPLDHAVKAFRVIKRLRDKGEAYQRNGHTIHLGHFALDAVDKGGNVTAGCHHVAWGEIERVAMLAGVN